MTTYFVSIQESIIDTSEDSQLQAAIIASQIEQKLQQEKAARKKLKSSDVTDLVTRSDSEGSSDEDEDVELETFSGKFKFLYKFVQIKFYFN